MLHGGIDQSLFNGRMTVSVTGFANDFSNLINFVSSTPTNTAERIYELKREVLELHAAIVPLAEPLDRLARGRHELIPEGKLKHPSPMFALGEIGPFPLLEVVMRTSELEGL